MVRIRYQQTSTASLLLTEASLEQNTDPDKLHPSLELPCNASQPYIQMHPAHNIGTASNCCGCKKAHAADVGSFLIEEQV